MFEKLERALKETDHLVESSRRTDASDGSIPEQAIQRIQDLTARKAGQDQKIDALEERKRLLEERAELKKRIADQNEQAASLQKILQDSMKRPRKKVLYNDDLKDPVIDELREKRMRIYEDARNA